MDLSIKINNKKLRVSYIWSSRSIITLKPSSTIYREKNMNRMQMERLACKQGLNG